MKEQQLKNILDFFNSRPTAKKTVVGAGLAVTYIMYGIYPLFIALQIYFKNPLTLRLVLVPAVSFVILSVFRRILNFKRPYEKFDITPLYNKTTKGCSFPSRHTFSAFMIAFAVMCVYPILGGILTFLGVLLALSRVLCGVHFIRDVAAGAIFAVVCALIGFVII